MTRGCTDSMVVGSQLYDVNGGLSRELGWKGEKVR